MKPSYYTDWERNRLARYQILMQRRQNIERIFWSRIQTLHLIQAGVLGGSFSLWKYHNNHPAFYLGLLILGIILTIILFVVCKNDWNDARRNDEGMHSLGDSLGIRRTAERKRKPRSHRLFYGVFPLFIFIDVELFLYFINPTIARPLIDLLNLIISN